MKKNLMTVLILALLIVNIVLNCVIMISVTSTNGKTMAMIKNIATALSLELVPAGTEKDTPAVSLADTASHTLGKELMFPLAAGADGKQSYLVCDITLSMNKKHKDYKTYGETIADHNGRIEDAVLTIVSSRTVDECRSDLEGLKAEILKAIQALFGSDFIYQVSISGVKYG